MRITHFLFLAEFLHWWKLLTCAGGLTIGHEMFCLAMLLFKMSTFIMILSKSLPLLTAFLLTIKCTGNLAHCLIPLKKIQQILWEVVNFLLQCLPMTAHYFCGVKTTMSIGTCLVENKVMKKQILTINLFLNLRNKSYWYFLKLSTYYNLKLQYMYVLNMLTRCVVSLYIFLYNMSCNVFFLFLI